MPTRRADFVEVQRFAAFPAKHLLFKPAIKKHLKRPTVTAALEETISRLVRLTVRMIDGGSLRRDEPVCSFDVAAAANARANVNLGALEVLGREGEGAELDRCLKHRPASTPAGDHLCEASFFDLFEPFTLLH
jgi:hypothetical protein